MNASTVKPRQSLFAKLFAVLFAVMLTLTMVPAKAFAAYTAGDSISVTSVGSEQSYTYSGYAYKTHLYTFASYLKGACVQHTVTGPSSGASYSVQIAFSAAEKLRKVMYYGDSSIKGTDTLGWNLVQTSKAASQACYDYGYYSSSVASSNLGSAILATAAAKSSPPVYYQVAIMKSSSSLQSIAVGHYGEPVRYYANGGTFKSSSGATNYSSYCVAPTTSSGNYVFFIDGDGLYNPYNIGTLYTAPTGYSAPTSESQMWRAGSASGTLVSAANSDDLFAYTAANTAQSYQSNGIYLYANWIPNTYYVRYNSNGGSGSMSNSTFTYGTTGYLRSNSFTRSGYTFEGWATSQSRANSGYVDYDNGDSVYNLTSTNGAYVDLYAVWTPSYRYLYYYPGSGSGSSYYDYTTYGSYLTVDSNSFTAPTGYQFSSWNLNSAGTSTSYDPGDSIYMSADRSLYAQWDPITYSVKYNANGGSGSMSNSTHTYGTAKALTANAYTKTGYTFNGWNANSSGTSTSYTDKQSVKNLRTTAGTYNIYAQWDPIDYSIVYNANGGSGSTASSSHTYDVTAPLTTNGFTRDGYTFKGWTTGSDGSGDAYTDGQEVTNLTTTDGATINLYAQWEEIPTLGAYVSQTGSDSNSGARPNAPVQTFRQAYSNIASTGGTIYVVGPVEVAKSMTMTSTYYRDSAGQIDVADGKTVTIKRYSQPTNPTDAANYNVASNQEYMIILNSGGTITFENIVVDGHNDAMTSGSLNENAPAVTSNHSIVRVNDGAVLNIYDGAVLKNNTAQSAGAVESYGTTRLGEGGSIQENCTTTTGGGGIVVSDGKFEMSGGTITNNNTADFGGLHGGGVYVEAEGEFEMSGGTISNNKAVYGGGVLNYGTMNMSAGLIDNNIATAYCDSSYSGGGGAIYNGYSGAVLNISGGTISNNNSYYRGGGIYNTGTLTVTGGTLSNNTAHGTGVDGDPGGQGGAIYNVGETTINGEDVLITLNTAESFGGGVCTYDSAAKLTLAAGSILDNTSVNNGGGVHSRGTFEMTGGSITNNESTSEGGAGLYVHPDTTATISGGKISGNSTSYSGGGVYVRGTLNMDGGEISGNSAVSGGGVAARGVFNMSDGVISGNSATNGGGVYGNGNVTMTGGDITGNTAVTNGGGVYVGAETVTGYFTMSGGTISGANSATNGGGIYINAQGDATVTGGTISGNAATGKGNGVFQGGTFKMGADGTVSADNVVYLDTDKFVTVISELKTAGTVAEITPSDYTLGRVCVEAAYGDTVASDVIEKYKLTENSPYLFRAGDGLDDSAGIADTSVIISRPYTVTYNANGGTGAPAAQTKYWNETLTLADEEPTLTGYTFINWNTAAAGTGTDYEPSGAYSANADATLYAQWEINTYTDHIHHVIKGVVIPGFQNGSDNASLLQKDAFDAVYNSSFTLGVDRVGTFEIPNGFALESKFGTDDITGSMAEYALGTSVTQIANPMQFEYYYSPVIYNVTYEVGTGSNSSANPSTYSVVDGFTLSDAIPAEGWKFEGWYLDDVKVTGINEGGNDFADADSFYDAMKDRSTGNITLEARYVPADVNIKYYVDGELAYEVIAEWGVAYSTPEEYAEDSLKPNVTRFDGWYTDSNFTEDSKFVDGTVLKDDVIFYGRNMVTLTLLPVESAIINNSSITFYDAEYGNVLDNVIEDVFGEPTEYAWGTVVSLREPDPIYHYDGKRWRTVQPKGEGYYNTPNPIASSTLYTSVVLRQDVTLFKDFGRTTFDGVIDR